MDRTSYLHIYYNQWLVTDGYMGNAELTGSDLQNMPSKKELKSEETKRAIVSAAGQLFADRGYEAVTMREIAKAAGCSHTTIYIYYK
ncbi:MAG: TetR/AcrR family transcriptional regulator, partial [Tumebacillaceae bacterium]